MGVDLTDFQTSVLIAVVEGYQAREGLKDRMRALNEWEIARRAGYELSYAEFSEHPARDTLLQALSSLQQRGLIGVWEHGAKYDSFVPTAAGTNALRAPEAEVEPTVASSITCAADEPESTSDPVLQRLDEIIRLLRSIDSKLGGR